MDKYPTTKKLQSTAVWAYNPYPSSKAPTRALLAGKADVLAEDRLWEGNKGKALAAHSTLTRLELGALGGDTPYKKIIARPEAIEALLIEERANRILHACSFRTCKPFGKETVVSGTKER